MRQPRSVRATNDEWSEITTAAAAAGMATADWVRSTLLAAARGEQVVRSDFPRTPIEMQMLVWVGLSCRMLGRSLKATNRDGVIGEALEDVDAWLKAQGLPPMSALNRGDDE